MWKTVTSFLILLVFVAALSAVSSRLWGGKPEELPQIGTLTVREGMTVQQFARANNLQPRILKKIFGLESREDLQRQLGTFGMSTEQIGRKTRRMLALQAEHGSKNWKKIFVKFALWIGFLSGLFVLLRRNKVTAKNRKWLMLTSAGVFGVILGSDPSPMGTVKDAIVLFGSEGFIFPPRLIAFGVFMLMVIIANKFICTWGCQLGTLQDGVFRLNRDRDDRKGILRQYKVPFAVSNTVRIAFFTALTLVAFVWATDIVSPIDPFKVFKPQVLGVAGIAFAGFILVASLLVYRPWCHFFCPFGLVGWLGEKLSFFKIQVDYGKCIACKQCEKACPSTVMGAILERGRVIPDCFACGTCIETCPVDAISFKSGRRMCPPEGKFDNCEQNESKQ